MVKSLPANAGDARDVGSILGSGRSQGNGNPFQYSCLENSVDRGDWQDTVQRVTKSQTQLSTQHTQWYYSAEVRVTLALKNPLSTIFYLLFQRDFIKFNLVWYNPKYDKAFFLSLKAQWFFSLLVHLLTMAVLLGSNHDSYWDRKIDFLEFSLYICVHAHIYTHTHRITYNADIFA